VVTRQAQLEQPAEGWPTQVRLGGLPLALADQSLRIRSTFPQGGGGLLATDLKVELDWQEPAPAPPIPTEHLLPLQGELRLLRAKIDTLNQDLSRLEALQPGSRPPQSGQPPAAYPLQARRSLVAMRQKLLAEGMERRQQLLLRLEEVSQQIKVATTPPPPVPLQPLYKAVVVTLRSQPEASASSLCLHLSYEMAGARWAPSYTLRFDRDFTMAELSMQAHLCQSSGEDWRSVHLEVSTANIAAWKELPELPSRRIGRQQQRIQPPGWRPAPPNTDSLFFDYDRKPSTRPAEPEPASAEQVAAFPDPVTRWQPEVFDEFVLDDLGPPDGDLFGGADPFASASVDPFAAADPFAAPADPFAEAPRPASSFGAVAQRASMVSCEVSSESPARAGMLRRRSEPDRLQARVSAPAPPGKPMLQRAPAGGGGAAPPPYRPAPPIPKAPVRPGSWEPVGPPTALSSPVFELSRDQLSYGLLYMPGPGERGRGRLQPQTALQACLKLWAERFPNKQPLDARRLIEEALRDSHRALNLQAPRDHSFPRSLNGFDYLYVGESPVDLDSDAQFHSVPLLVRQLPTHLLWLVVPKVTCDVFRQARVESLPDLAVPAGPIDIYVNHDYLATTQLGDVAPGEAFTLGLGVEQSVKVVRNTTFKETTAGMMGGTLQLRHEVVVEAANQLQREVRLEVQESLPQPASEGGEIKVKVDSCEPAWEPIPEQAGAYRWALRIPAGETRKAQLAYLVEMPSKLELVGGNRREE
jgi:hypothetical protein